MATKRKTKKKTATKRARAIETAAAPAAKLLESMSMPEIEAQLAVRKRAVARLERRRERLRDQIAEIDAELAGLTGRVPGGGGRPRNEFSLGDALAGVLKNKQMSIAEATQAVIDAGYITTAKNFRTMVNQQLISDKRFRKIERGVYARRA